MKLCIDMLDVSQIETRHDMYLAGLVHRAIVLLNHKRVSECIFADEEAGFVVCYDLTRGPVNDQWLKVKYDGEVRIIDPDEEDMMAEGYLRCDRG